MADAAPTVWRGGRLLIGGVVGLILLVAAVQGFTWFYIEVLWHNETGYLSAFWTRVRWEWGTRIVAGAGVAVLIFLNLRVAATTLGGIQIRRRFGNIEIAEQISGRMVSLALGAAALLIGLWFGASVVPSIGRQFLLAFSAPEWGISDPSLGRDLGFYVFWYPVLAVTVTYGLTTTFLVFTLVVAGYAATGALSWGRGRIAAHPVARKHLGGIMASFFVLVAAQIWLSRFDLLLSGNSAVQGIFGFTDAHARLGALQTLSVLSVLAAAAIFWGAWSNHRFPMIAAVSGMVIATVLIGNIYPSLVQSFRVEPNELELETPFIERSMEFTRLAFGLDELERTAYAYDADAPVDWEAAADQLAGMPVWGSGATAPMLTTYNEVEARFRYYQFDDVTIDRYRDGDRIVPVALSVRQVDTTGIPDRNWQNLHLRELYVAGLGAVASLAAERNPEGRPNMLVRGLPPEIDPAAQGMPEVRLERPEVFFGTRQDQRYAIATPGPDQFLAPDGSRGTPGVDFPEGISLNSPIRTAMLAWRFGTTNLLFSAELDDESRLVHRRRVVDRARAIAPFLRFPDAPYPVLHDGRIVWILEGFTATRSFPLSASYRLGTSARRVQYARNSFKISVDAVTGEMHFYRVPIDDPLADAYLAAYPDLFESIDEMPSGLRAHLRYPRAFLDLQAEVLLQYHQETAATFHGQQDVWAESEEQTTGTSGVPYRPEYGFYRLPGEADPRFQLTTVFVPAGRENLTAIVAARTDDRGVPSVLLFDVPIDAEVRGPRLIEALAEQDVEISQQFTLWRSGGSRVWTGHLHVLPVGGRLLYMEPVFLAAEDDAIPDLARFVVSDGRRVVMTETLAEGLAQLAGGAGEEMLPEATRSDDGESSTRSSVGEWPDAALTLLEQAEARAAEGDWQGFGAALDALRALLEELRGGSE